MRLAVALVTLRLGAAFAPSIALLQRSSVMTPLSLSPDQMTPEQLKMSADMFKNLNAEQIDMMLKQVENMGPAEREQYSKMGVNLEMLKMSMRALKNNPRVLELARKQMESMTPEQLAQASRMAQQQFESVSPAQFEQMAAEAAQNVQDFPASPVPASVVDAVSSSETTARDSKLIESMFTTAQYCANPPSGGVDLATLKKLPPIAALRGDRPDDLSDDELAEICHDVDDAAQAQLGCGAKFELPFCRGPCHQSPSLQVDRAGFERVWLSIDDLYEEDLMVEARRPPKKSRAD